jgi:hypothetical protein
VVPADLKSFFAASAGVAGALIRLELVGGPSIGLRGELAAVARARRRAGEDEPADARS